MNDRTYLIVLVSEIYKIDFSQTLFRNLSELQYSLDGSKTYIKWDTASIPTFVSDFSYTEGPYNNNEMIIIISSPEWYEEST